ncbi:hypothetical protein [Streptomyces sp. NPDC019224]
MADTARAQPDRPKAGTRSTGACAPIHELVRRRIAWSVAAAAPLRRPR